jgi:hypothetical protein
VPFPGPQPVDSRRLPGHNAGVKKKQVRVEEAAPHYAAKKPAKAKPAPTQPGIRYADLKKVRETNTKLIHVHRTVLQKLAQ